MADSDDKPLIHLRDGEVVLYKRSNIPRWQARYKLSSGEWRRISTKTPNLDRAKSIATEAYDRARFLQKEGLRMMEGYSLWKLKRDRAALSKLISLMIRQVRHV